MEELNFPLQLQYSTFTAEFPLAQSTFAPMRAILPENAHIITLSPLQLEDNLVVLRLFNPFELGEHPTLSQTAIVDINTLFAGYELQNVQEKTLTVII